MEIAGFSPRLAQPKDVPKIFELNLRVAPTSLVQWSVAMIEEEIIAAQSKVWVVEDPLPLRHARGGGHPDLDSRFRGNDEEWGSSEESLTGFLCARHLVEGQWEIRNLAVAPEYWGQGLAQKLFETFQYYVAKPAEVFLEVAVSNLRAIRFYEKVGAKRLYLRKNLYGNVDGWVFVLKWA